MKKADPLFPRFLLIIVLLFVNSLVEAQSVSLPASQVKSQQEISFGDLSATKQLDGPLLNSLDGMIKKPRERKQLLAYLKTLEIENPASGNQAKTRFYYHLANTFARLRLYPLAMKCFLKASSGSEPKTISEPHLLADTMLSVANDLALSNLPASLPITTDDDSLINEKVTELEHRKLHIKSRPITYQHIQQTFNDGKMAVAYAMLIHVKQPVRGKRKIFVWNNVGHTFITLIKYNADSTCTSLSCGFYPKKDNLLSATPLIPTTSSVFKDDSGHDWDEVLGKFISRKRFERIQNLILRYNGLKYNLSKNNCTDFGIKAAELAGIKMGETYGTWPLGSGNNPAITGQSIIAHNFENDRQAGNETIFMDVVSAADVIAADHLQ